MTRRRCYQILEIDLDHLAELFGQGNEVEFKVVEGLPADASIDACEYDMRKNTVRFRVHSRKFPAIKKGEVIPYTFISLEKRTHYKTTQLADDTATI